MALVNPHLQNTGRVERLPWPVRRRYFGQLAGECNCRPTLRSSSQRNLGVDSNADRIFNDGPDLIGNYHVSGNRAQRVAEYFNPKVLVAAPPGGYGHVQRNFLFGPGYLNTDLSFFRLFPISERQHIQFCAEMFNASTKPIWKSGRWPP